MKSVGEVIKDYRKRAKITQRQLGKILNVRELTVGGWERGYHVPNQDIVVEKLEEIIPELRGHKDLRDVSIVLEEGDGGRTDPVKAFFWTALRLSNKYPKRLKVTYGEDKVGIWIKMPR